MEGELFLAQKGALLSPGSNCPLNVKQKRP